MEQSKNVQRNAHFFKYNKAVGNFLTTEAPNKKLRLLRAPGINSETLLGINNRSASCTLTKKNQPEQNKVWA